MSGVLLAAVGNSYGYKPINTVAPAITGTAQARQTLTCSTGTWDAAPLPITYTYQWKKNGSNISGATSSTYVVASADVGSTLRCTVTATNAVGATSADSNTTATVIANVPAAPTIGTATATGSSTATVAFTPPTDNGGATITSYTAVSSPGSITGTGTSSPITVSGLSPNTTYTFRVYATNSVGNSALSNASNSITTQDAYWFSRLSASMGNYNYNNALKIYTAGQPIAGFHTYEASLNEFYAIVKWNNDGSVAYQKAYYNNGLSGYMLEDPGLALTGSGTPVIAGTWRNNSNGVRSMTYAGLDGSGNLSYTYILSATSNYYMRGCAVSIIGSNIIIGGFTGDGGNNGLGTASVTTGGGLNWVTGFQPSSSASQQISGNDTDGTYIYSYGFSALNATGSILMKQASDGSTFYANGTRQVVNVQGYDVAAASDGSAYVVGLNVSGTPGAHIAGFNSAGTVQWQRQVTNSGTSASFRAVTVGDDGFVYAGGHTGTSPGRAIIAKYSTGGSLQWLREITVSGVNLPGVYGIEVKSGTMYLLLSSATNPFWACAKLPADGSRTGTYGIYTYSGSSCSEGAGSNSIGNFGGNIPYRSNSNFTITNPGLGLTNTSYTTTVTNA